ncbi:levansucrase [Loktanella sp. 3ANDIMAR09]|uniref:levansucrase n=1 Tax=Loktanella sp. 3ANDIMAR09 TaxID=1225657 RepID=UPI0006F49F4D|nr:levansucrase [Loktanella sp. 3ANDIMAR09]KQI68346.1 levansucrase [Loktanella sp. 3ANDIMAR09]
MVLALDDQFIWDSWYLRDGDVWHGYFLQAPRDLGDPDLRHWNVSIGHATSVDLVNWTHLGRTFGPAEGQAWDNYTTWTGCVVRGDDARWHLYYTGTNRAEHGLYQRIGHAVSDDLHHWSRVGDGLALDMDGPNARHYEATHQVGVWSDRAMRDPWVIRDPQGPGWLMFFTARAAGIAEPNAGGCIGLATSPDGVAWTLQPPVFIGEFGQLEVPKVFDVDGRWFCLFSTAAEHFSAERAAMTRPVTGSHYLIGDGPRGPWRLAPGFLDGALPPNRYAASLLDTDQGLMLMGFADRPDGETFVGHIMDPVRVDVTPDGLLVRVDAQTAADSVS